MVSRHHRTLAVLLAIAGGAWSLAAPAQTIGYGNVSGASDTGGGPQASAGGGASESGKGRGGRSARSRTVVSPYIEAAQVVRAELSPDNEVLTYSQVAAGVDAEIHGRNTGASVSLRYERRFGWGKAEDGDTISGVARGYMAVAPGVRFDAGAMAARTRVENTGAAVLGQFADDDAVTQMYSVYAGPSVSTRAGDVAINADYKIGYTRVESPDVVIAPGTAATDVFDDSVSQLAGIHAGVKPYDVLPVGLGVGANYYREDISNLDQRVEDFRARADVTVPVQHNLSVVGGVGYEKVEISSRDALYDGNGDPVVGRNGRYVTDKSKPRVIAYDTSGLIWDVGVIWRPSRRTALEAHVGRRYGSTTYYGTFAYAPNARSALNISVYDNVAGFGGQLTRALADLPTEFRAVRNPLTGDISGCVASVSENPNGQGNCLSGALGSVRSSVFRARGVMATYGVEIGNLQTGIGAGYDRRRFIGAPGTVLELADGVIDENYWLAGYLSGRIDQRSSYSTNLYANWFRSRAAPDGDMSAIGASAAYNRLLTHRLSATAAVSLDGLNRDRPLEDLWVASALLGMRYSF